MKVPETKKCRQVNIFINNQKICVDGYVAKTNTIYEFWGDFFHGNKKIYPKNKMNTLIGCTFGELYKKTMKKEKLIKSAGYKLITIWESDFKN
jgi:hypothetical protein